MIIGLDAPPDWSQYRYTIVGSGFAGQFLAERLSPYGRVLMLEAGPMDQPLSLGAGYYELDSTGLPTSTLGTRLSAFGGTSNHWTGQSRPFSPRIFENRDAIGIAGWPIPWPEFAAYVPQAASWLGLPTDFDAGAPPSLASGLLAGMRGLVTHRFFRPDPVQQLGMGAHRERCLARPNIDVLPSTRVVDIVLNPATTAAESVLVADAAGRRTTVPVETLLLAAGGIENARLMLWAGQKYAPGNPLVGGPNALTGRYLTEHPVYFPAELAIDHRVDTSDAVSQDTATSALQHFMWAPNDEALERHALPRFGMLLMDEGGYLDPQDLATDDAAWLTHLMRPRVTIPAVKFEQTPHLGGFVGLSSRLDRDGTPLARVHWALAEGDVEAFRRGTLLLLSLLSQRGLIRARLREEYRSEDWSGIIPTCSSHHIGTTRMAHAASAGVVDTNCRVFGLANLYVAGSSVFPHGDYLNPTLNFLALTARLADHLTEDRLQLPRRIRFGATRPGNAYLTAGWSHPEPPGIWSDGPEARIVVPEPGIRQLRFYGSGYREGHVVVSVNGATMFEGPIRSLVNNNRPIFDCACAPAEQCELVFRFSGLRSPNDYRESDDQRLLGVFLRWLEVVK